MSLALRIRLKCDNQDLPIIWMLDLNETFESNWERVAKRFKTKPNYVFCTEDYKTTITRLDQFQKDDLVLFISKYSVLSHGTFWR